MTTVLFLFVFQLAWANPEITDDGNPVVKTDGDLVTQELEVEEAIAQVPDNADHIEIETKKGFRYRLPLKAPDDLTHLIQMSMPEADRRVFQENRIFFLSRVASTLEKTALTVGFASLIKNKLLNIFKKEHRGQHPLKISQFRDRGHEMIGGLLMAMDLRLWQQAPVVVKQNEFTVSLGLSVSALGGVGHRGAGGLFGLGMSIGMNKTSKLVVFEFFSEIERFERALVPSLLIGPVPKVSFTMADQNEEVAGQMTKGHSLYTPAAPVFISASQNTMTMGIYLSYFASIPVHGSLQSFQTKAYRKPLLRIKVRSLMRGLKNRDCENLLRSDSDRDAA